MKQTTFRCSAPYETLFGTFYKYFGALHLYLYQVFIHSALKREGKFFLGQNTVEERNPDNFGKGVIELMI
jgi:hypothetical protein